MNTSVQCSVLSAQLDRDFPPTREDGIVIHLDTPPLKRLNPTSELCMDLTAAYLATRKFTRMSVDGFKKRNRDWAKRELAKSLVAYDQLKKQAEREGYKV